MSKVFTSPFQTAGRRGYHHGNLRESLIEAARFLIAERGPQGFTLIEAARLVDVSPAAPYRHFKDRDALVGAVAAQGFEAFAARLRAAGRGANGGLRLQALGAAYLAFAREEPGYYGAMFLANRTAAPPEGQGFDILIEAVREALAAGGPDVAATAMQIWALAHGVAVLAASGQWPRRAGAPLPDAVLAAGARAILGGTGPEPARKDS
jgi:AcrR family transcriptional regulator